jgi:hypothetical protein
MYTLPLQAEGSYLLAGTFVLLLLAGSTGYWVYLDGAKRGIDRAPWWGAGVFWLLLLGVVPGLVALGIYLSRR